ncbi:MAG: FliG C-terminal domain-containing protein [Deltaproteobacteria bacterium]|nr:FliG C-terminal domain-containing protein [Deltaproteobacteria bacterium]
MTATQAIDKPMSALLLVLSLEEEAVSRVLRHLDPEDIRTLHQLASREFAPTGPRLTAAYQGFLAATREPVLPTGEGSAYIERLAQRSLGREESKIIFQTRDTEVPFSDLERRNAKAVATVLEGENPRVIAAILSEISAAYAASVLAHFETALRVKVMLRLASLDQIPTQTIDALHRAVREQLSNVEAESGIPVDGIGRAASILQRLPMAEAEDLLGGIGEGDPGLAFKLRRQMFSFEDLVNVQGRGMQTLVKEVSNDQLLLALKTASDALKDKILTSVSKRAAEILIDDLSAMGPVKLSDVERTQQEIVDMALRLEAEGKIVIAGRGGEELV